MCMEVSIDEFGKVFKDYVMSVVSLADSIQNSVMCMLKFVHEHAHACGSQ